MKLKKIKKAKNTLRVEVQGEDHTLLNVLREKAWTAGATQASYMIRHPYLSEPTISIIAADPKKVLVAAAQHVATDAAAFQRAFAAALKR